MEDLIYVDSLVVRRRTSDVLRGLSFLVKSGEVYALLGGNGAGKTTTLHACLGLIAPESGQIKISGLDPSSDIESVRKKVAYLPENVALYGHLDAVSNIQYFLSIAEEDRPISEIRDALKTVKLDEASWPQRLENYSKGMKQKTAIALALLRAAPVLLLDEPTSGLDPTGAHELNGLLNRLKESGAAILMVTHDLLGVADVADRIGLLAEGRMAQEWTAQDTSDRFDLKELYRAFSPRTA